MVDPTLENKLSLIKEDVQSIEEKVKSIKVVDENSQKMAITFISEIKSRLKRIEDLRKFFTGGLNQEIKKINSSFKAQTEPLERFEAIISEQIKGYMDEQARIAQAEADRIRKEQEAKEAEERKARLEAEKKAAEEERLRKEAENAKNEEEKKKLLDKAEKAKQQSEVMAQQAEEKKAEAEALLPVEAPQKSVRSDGGLATRALVWKWELESAVLAMKAHPELFVIDSKAVNKLIQEGTRTLAGIRIYQDSQVRIKL